jgi:hypothetical protein
MASECQLRVANENRRIEGLTPVLMFLEISEGQLARLPDGHKDNHIVLIDPNDTHPSLGDEPKSQTAEFTPRVRLTQANLKWSKLNALIQAASRRALKVRVTGLQMFDSHHFFHASLPRHNNWEIHPVFKLEYCPKFKHCEAGSDTNWVSLQP